MKKILLFLALLALVILAWCCIYKHHPSEIQQDITSRTQQALDEAKADTFSMSVDGRDVYLSSASQVSESEKESVLELVANVWGVRTVTFNGDVHSEAKVAPPISEPPPPPSVAIVQAANLNATYDGNKLVLNGVLASETDIQLLLTDIKKIFGSDINIVNNLTTGSEATPLVLLKEGLVQLSGLSTGSLSLNQQNLRLSGEVASPIQQQSTQSDFEQLSVSYPKFDFATDLQIASSYDSQACQDRLNDLVKNSNIRFQSGKADIRRDSLPLLNRISLVGQRCEASIHIKGHTDSSGNADFNLYLSQQRAKSVKDYLIKKGVAALRIKASGYGETSPIADNTTATGRALNRRIEFNVE